MPNQLIECNNVAVHPKYRFFALIRLSLSLLPQQGFLLLEFEILAQFPLFNPFLVERRPSYMLATTKKNQ
jgi:hypothetical protein